MRLIGYSLPNYSFLVQDFSLKKLWVFLLQYCLNIITCACAHICKLGTCTPSCDVQIVNNFLQSFVYYTIFVFLSKFNFLNLLHFGKKRLSRQARYAEETLITCVVIRFSYVGEFFRCYCWLFVRLLLLIIRWEAIPRICRNY